VTHRQRIATALARIPRSGPLETDVHAEAAGLIKKLRPLLVDYRLGAVVRALFTLAAEYARQLLRAEAAGCDCTHDISNGLHKCPSSRHHAVTDIVIEEVVHNAKQR